MEGHLRSQSGLSRKEESYDAIFTDLYQRYFTRVFAFVYSRVGNVDLTKDLTAEIFERAYVKGHSLRDPEAYATWLFMIAKNVVVGYYRKQKRESNGLNRMKEALSLTQPPPDPEDQAINNERLRQLLESLRTLSQRDQELLSLKFDAALSYAEIARITGMSEVNVRVSIFRALKRLRQRVGKLAPNL